MLQAMRKVFTYHPQQELTEEERAALDAYLQPRLEALAEEMAARLIDRRTAPIGSSRRTGGRRKSE